MALTVLTRRIYGMKTASLNLRQNLLCYMAQGSKNTQTAAQSRQVHSIYYLVPMNRQQVLECFRVPVVILLIAKLKAQNALNMLHA